MIVDKIIDKSGNTREEELDITGATLLSIDEANKIPSRLRIYDVWWWLRSPGNYSNCAAFVDLQGSVNLSGDFVDIEVDAVRPALLLKNLKSSNLKIGDVFIFNDQKFEIVSDRMAFCSQDIGSYYFRKDRNAIDANNYEKSDIKRYINRWF